MSDSHPFGIPNPFVRNVAGRRRRRLAMTGVALALVLALVTALVVCLLGSPSCGDGVVRRGGECVGVTDGSFDFDPAMKAIDQDILRENHRVEASGDTYVTIAFLGALSTTAKYNLTGGRAVHQVEGAYIAQRRANNGAGGGNSPKIRLVLANEGSDQSQWSYVIGRLKAMVKSDHLVAATGLGLSTRETVLSAKALSAAEIAMVADVVTGDGIDSSGAAVPQVGAGPASRIQGLTRVGAHVGQEVSVLAQYFHGREKTAAMVVDQRATDLYSRSLINDFRAAFGGSIKKGGRFEEPFTADSPTAPGIQTLYHTVAVNLNLCGGDPPDIVIYAGRTIFLPGLMESLEHCAKNPITVVTGSDAEGVVNFSDFSPASIIYTPLADPGRLDGPANPSREAYQAFLADCAKYYAGFKPGDLRDAWGLMAHDAVLTAAQATRLAAGPQGGKVPSPRDVAGLLYNLHSANKVEGASGPIEIDGDGNPTPRPLPVMRLAPDGTRTFLGAFQPAPGR